MPHTSFREAWNVCGSMSKDIAMQIYVEELSEVGHIVVVISVSMVIVSMAMSVSMVLHTWLVIRS